MTTPNTNILRYAVATPAGVQIGRELASMQLAVNQAIYQMETGQGPRVVICNTYQLTGSAIAWVSAETDPT